MEEYKMLPDDYLERVYSGVLGKLIGVYLGRPFEGWTYARIMEELGPIEYYVHERLGDPLVITDDDVAGTFTFIRALEDYNLSADLSAEDIGKSWLNYLIEHRAILWWGGNGNSTEHTAWLNLKRGVPAPHSGSIATNGATVAEQIGAQIFIDGWALVSPGNPDQAVKLATQAGSVSHDGESVYAAMLWAAMEAQAFLSKDVDQLIDTGLSYIPTDCLIAKLIADVRKWHQQNPQWQDTRATIQEKYGYDKFCGNCHVIPNHALMIMAMLYAPHDFQRGQMIVNTSGWDTDCNAGNVGCLHGIMLGLDGLDAGPDWRGPIADRMLISSSDGGNSINDAVRMSYYIAGLGRALSGAPSLPAPKTGAQFHFSLPGSTQGFSINSDCGCHDKLLIKNIPFEQSRALALDFSQLTAQDNAVITTPTFSSTDVLRMRTYELMATPLVYPGQTVRARLAADQKNSGTVAIALRLKHFCAEDALQHKDSDVHYLDAGDATIVEWTIPDCGSQPIAELGLVVSADSGTVDGRVVIDYLGWEGTPELTLQRPVENSDFWHRAWVNGVDMFSKRFPQSFHISQSRGEGLIIHGTRDWTDYHVETEMTMHLGKYAGLTARTQGLRRYYAARIHRDQHFDLVRVMDDECTVLAQLPFNFELDSWVPMTLTVDGASVRATAAETTLSAEDNSTMAITCGGIGLQVYEGAASAQTIHVRAQA